MQASFLRLDYGTSLRLRDEYLCIAAGAHATLRRASRLAALIAVALLLTPAVASAGRLDVAWDPSPDSSVTGYVIYYGTAAGVYDRSVDVGNRTTFSIDGVTEGLTYYLVVKSYNAAGDFSLPSNEVRRLGAFSDDPLTPGVHAMRLAHLTELRARIDELRAAWNLSPMPWTAIGVGAPVRAGDIGELRTALNAVYVAMHRTPPAYADAFIVPGLTRLKAAHVSELRAAVVALE